jgi:hypothetical protein
LTPSHRGVRFDDDAAPEQPVACPRLVLGREWEPPDDEIPRLMPDMTPITNDEAEAFAAKFAGWSEQLTDRERIMLGTALAATRDNPIGAVRTMTASPTVGPVIAAVLSAVAAVIVMISQIEAKALEDQAAAKEKEAGEADISNPNLGHLPSDRTIQSSRRGRDLGLPDDD